MTGLGLDTSNYTTSVALYRDDDGTLVSRRKLLPVKPGELGLRQSDAVFHHTVQLPALMQEAFDEMPGAPDRIAVSVSPTGEAGSYMPCFLPGKTMAQGLGAALGIPVIPVTHQAGHIAAVLYSAGRTELVLRPFVAFHVSGGTTEAVAVTPDEKTVFACRPLARSLDLKAGQAIDRVGKLLGLPFPAGKALDALSLQSDKTYRVRPFLRDGSCSLSGVENRCRAMLEKGESAPDIANYCLSAVIAALEGMVLALDEPFRDLPLVFSGGVTENTLLRRSLGEKFDIVFAGQGFAADNAAGVAWLGSIWSRV
ncbi:MAG: peptidase M22 [Clostridia bacterium]|nr:peptidase M22 [Clostridia bacterium]